MGPTPLRPDYLGCRGYKTEHEHIMVEGWQVQFLPADDALYAEALSEAVGVLFDGTKTWVMRAEHLMAIALKTGRGKDFIRINQFLSSGEYDRDRLNQILARHGLLKKFEEFKGKYTGENS
ncbi:MAG TPA: hypothetical protein VGN61_15345 [Verrucomicrobiae bacterium]